MSTKVIWGKSVNKQLDRIPDHILEKFRAWVIAVETDGLRSTCKLPGFNDEVLKGKRKGQRSIRLSRAYRAIYIESKDGSIELVEVIEVNKHEY